MSGGTDNHLMLVDLRSFDAELTGKKARLALDRAGITLNENTVPDDPRPPFVTSGLRIGTPAVTTQGMGEPEMARSPPSSTAPSSGATTTDELAAVRDEVAALCSKFPPYSSDVKGCRPCSVPTPACRSAAPASSVSGRRSA